MSTDPTALAREVLDTYAAWGKTAAGSDECTRATEAFTDAVNRGGLNLARAALAVSEMHDPLRVYDECGDPECLNDHEWIADTFACEDSAIGWACARCCYDGEHPLECDDHHGDHKGVPQVRACATRAALNGDPR